MYMTNKQLAKFNRELDVLLGDVEETQLISDYTAYEIYKKYYDDVKPLLLAYADILAKTGKPYLIEESPKLRKWINEFSSASNCHEPILAADNIIIADSLKQAVGEIDARSPFITAASIIEVFKKPYVADYNEFTGGNE